MTTGSGRAAFPMFGAPISNPPRRRVETGPRWGFSRYFQGLPTDYLSRCLRVAGSLSNWVIFQLHGGFGRGKITFHILYYHTPSGFGRFFGNRHHVRLEFSCLLAFLRRPGAPREA